MQIMQNAEHFVISTRVSLAETNLTENKRFSSAKLFQLTSQRGDEHKSWYTWIRGIYISTYVSLTETNVLVTRPNVSPTYFNSHPHKETNSIP